MSTVVATDRISMPTGVPQFAPPPYSHTWASERGYTVVRWILGLLLITTAVMKLTGGSGEILRVALPFVSPRIYASGVVFELILGLWLISGLARAWSWLIALLFFGLLGYMSFRLGWFGQASCGCFGKIAVNPWWAFAIDVSAVAGLLAMRPQSIVRGLQHGVPVIVGALIVLGFIFLTLLAIYPSAGSVFAHLTNELIRIDPPLTDIGSGKLNDKKIVKLIVTNYSDRAFRIVGWSNDCSCLLTNDLPKEISPGNSQELTLQMKHVGTIGRFHHRFALYGDDKTLRIMPFSVVGRTVE